jgi:hypothetical protein
MQNMGHPVDCARLIVLDYLASECCKSERAGLHIDASIRQQRLLDVKPSSADELSVPEIVGMTIMCICVLLSLAYFYSYIFDF